MSRLQGRVIGTPRSPFTSSAYCLRGQNLVERITQRYMVDSDLGRPVYAGDVVSISPEHILTHDNTGAVMKKFASIGASKILHPTQPVFALDHDVQNKSEANLHKYASIEHFASRQHVDFYPAGRGIGHQIMVEEGYAFPGTLTVASDSHSNMYGGIGALGTPLVRTDAAAVWATGRTWWQVPPVARCELKGKLAPGVTGKDVIVTLCAIFGKDQVLNHAVEFTGEGAENLRVSDRLAIANMTTEWGALAGVFPADGKTWAWVRSQAEKAEEARKDKRATSTIPSTPTSLSAPHPRLNAQRIEEAEREGLKAEQDAYYAKYLEIDLGSIVPAVSGPNSVKHAQPVTSLRGTPVHKAYLVSCVNSRVEDIKEAAEVVRGRKVPPDVEFYIAAASSRVQGEVEKSGDWGTLLDAGAIPLPAGCGPCIGLGTGLLKEGEVGISATNRNFKGRMGSLKALAYLASPSVVAASAVAGKITDPTELASPTGQTTSSSLTKPEDIGATLRTFPPPPPLPATSGKGAGAVSASSPSGFPPHLDGEVIFCPADNLNTDGIYPGKYTYKDDLVAADMAKVVMENYDPSFAGSVRSGDILMGGFNFGTGSSREQAATALLASGIRCVIAGSFSETYKRNAINNALVCVEAPGLVRHLAQSSEGKGLTIRTGQQAKVHFAQGMIEYDGQEWACSRVGKAAQEVVGEGGLENWVRRRI
ncbi:aconitase A [Piptocephalis cylindrospora]|uniref:Homoaconitase, mitochondrial n=1 Tax=Piptocephalis cylindrospora TaxID=1907219 RepID=A0A4P9Y753_9FUNG|nr:aconitase A [Piptocephalis cylindrospora]|eukprot:RKP14936.1 aconitase A [Piptocephalis cylindrospora]